MKLVETYERLEELRDERKCVEVLRGQTVVGKDNRAVFRSKWVRSPAAMVVNWSASRVFYFIRGRMMREYEKPEPNVDG